MTKQQLQDLFTNTSPLWFVMDMVGHQFTLSSGGKNLCIDFIVFNDKMRDYLNIASVCNSFNDISDHFPLILSCKKTSPDGFTTPLLKRKLNGPTEYVVLIKKKNHFFT